MRVSEEVDELREHRDELEWVSKAFKREPDQNECLTLR